MISFVIPTLNEIKTIEQTLQCLAAYSGTHEIIISDGNSKDGTVDICRKYTDNVVVYDKPDRQTIAMARNMGAADAKGEYLVFLDADVVIPDIDRFFEAAEEAFRSDERLVALTVQYKVVPEQRTLADGIFFRMLGLQFLLSNNVLRIGAAGGEFQMIAGDAFRSVGGFNEKLDRRRGYGPISKAFEDRPDTLRKEPHCLSYRQAGAYGWLAETGLVNGSPIRYPSGCSRDRQVKNGRKFVDRPIPKRLKRVYRL